MIYSRKYFMICNARYAEALRRTVYGFMAVVICLFLTSLCVIKKVGYHLPFVLHTLNISAETRRRAVQENRRQTRGQRLCLRMPVNPKIPFSNFRPLSFT